MDPIAQMASAELAARGAGSSGAAPAQGAAAPDPIMAAIQAQLAARAAGAGGGQPTVGAPGSAGQPTGAGGSVAQWSPPQGSATAPQGPFAEIALPGAPGAIPRLAFNQNQHPARSVGQALGTMASGMGGMIAGGLRGAGEAGTDLVDRVTGSPLSFPDPAGDVGRTERRYTLQPTDPYAQRVVGALGAAQNTLGQGAQEWGDLTRRGAQAIGLPPWAAALAGTGVDTGMQALLMKGAGDAPFFRPTSVNIGMNVGDRLGMRPADVLAELKRQGVNVKDYAVRDSASEPTVVARTHMPLSAQQGMAISRALRQQAITQSGPAGSETLGPLAQNWPFDPGYFLKQNGQRGAPAPFDPELIAARDAQIRVTPHFGHAGLGSRALESVGGSAKLGRGLSIKNADVISRGVNAQIGLPEGETATPASLDALRAEPNAVYREAAQAGPVDTSGIAPDLQRYIVGARRKMQFGAYDPTAMDADELVHTVRQLRATGNQYLRATRYNPAFDAIGRNQIAAANALDEALDAHAGQASQGTLSLAGPGQADIFGAANAPRVAPDIVPRLRAARQRLAQIASAERALRANGYYDPADFARQLHQNVPLSGAMETYGKLAQRFQRELQDPNKIRDAGPLSWMDAVPSVAGAIALHQPELLAGMLARPAIRGALESRWYQNRFIMPHVKVPLTDAQSFLRRSSRIFPLMPGMDQSLMDGVAQPQYSRKK